MANHKSAEKRNRQSQKRRARNVSVRTQVKTAVKKAREGFASKDTASMKDAFKALNKAASKGVLHKRTAARRISRLAKAANKSAK